MAEAATKSVKEQSASGLEGRPRELAPQPAISGGAGQILKLQQTIGNRVVNNLLQSTTDNSPQHPYRPNHLEKATSLSGAERPDSNSQTALLLRANAESGSSLDESVRMPMENNLGVSLGWVRVHSGPASEAAAESLGARAYTIGSNIHLGPDARRASSDERNRLLAHEAVHTVQQGGQPVALQGKLKVSDPSDHAEVEADRGADSVISGAWVRSTSPTLALRSSMRVIPVAPMIQRDIKGNKKMANGKFEIDFTKNDATVAGGKAEERGKITFTPNATAPESDSIRFVQIVRTTDKSTATETEYVWTGGEAPRNKQQTASAPNVASGYYVDQNAASLAKRNKKSEPDVLPYYDITGPPIADNKIGRRRGATIEPAVLADTPGDVAAGRTLFVASAKASDTGTWYGTVLWGFEIYLDGGIAKIRGEYQSFRENRGATTDAALSKFNTYYQNKGTPGAPTTD